MQNHRHKVYVGIDIHRREHVVAVIPSALLQRSRPDWKNAQILSIRNERDEFVRLDLVIKAHVQCPAEAAIAVDHTGGHYCEPLVYYLRGKGYNVCHLEAKAVKAARERLLDEENKTDTIDATGAAYLLYLRDTHGFSFGISSVVPELGSQAATLRSLILQQQQYVKMTTQLTNRLHQFLLAVFPEAESNYFTKLLRIASYYPTPPDIIASQGLKNVKYLSKADREVIMRLASNTVGVPPELYRELIRNLCQFRTDAIAKRDEIAALISQEVINHPYGHCLLSFPSFGTIAAASIIGVVNDISRWPDKKKLKKALGIYSTLKQSAASSARGRQGKEGNRHTRRALCQVVFRCIQVKAADNDFKDYYHRQVARGKPKLKAVVSTMGKLAEIIYHCLKTEECYQYQGKYRLR